MKNIKSLFTGRQGQNYLYPFILVTGLFFMWGFAHSLLDVLNKHFQESLHLTKAQSGAIQTAAYGAYFIMAIPAGIIARKFGYKIGIIIGLILFAAGAFWFIPAVSINAFWAFLLGLLILFSGLTFLETVANPYTTVLGAPESAARRINLAQTFNAVGWICGPLIGSLLILGNSSVSSNATLIPPYVGLGILVLLMLLLFLFVKLPEVNAANYQLEATVPIEKPLIRQRHFLLAVIAQFLYVAAQTGIGSFFINYSVEIKALHLTNENAGFWLALGGMSLFAVGRFLGSLMMKKIKAETLLGSFAFINVLLMLVVIECHNVLGFGALVIDYFFMSIMFPSIFALGIKGLGNQTKTASSILVLTVVGGAVAPPLMGYIGEKNMNIGFIIPLFCFLYISFFGYFGTKIKE